MSRRRPIFRHRRRPLRTLWRATCLSVLLFGLLVACS
jgi:hypothetical protein